MTDIVPIERVASKIFAIRDTRVMLDRDHAELYGIETRALKQAVRRNIKSFPEEFMFQLTKDEKAEVVAICNHLSRLKFSLGFREYL
jgi:phosphopentomutase